MAQIIINEISQNYTYNIGTNAYAIVALPITASWGPAYMDPDSLGKSLDEVLEDVSWDVFPATQNGLEAFVSAYRGPASNYRIAKDYSYQMAMTLLTSGYDVQVCRVCPGTQASTTINFGTVDEPKNVTIKAKYPGTFGNNLRVLIQKVPNRNYWNVIIYVVDASGIQTAVENLTFVFDLANSSDSILHIDEVESNFITFIVNTSIDDSVAFPATAQFLKGGTDRAADSSIMKMMEDARKQAEVRYQACGYDENADYLQAMKTANTYIGDDISKAATIRYKEWCYTAAYHVYDLLKDKLSYKPNRVISPGWDDQDIGYLEGQPPMRFAQISPLHLKLLETAYYSRCATAYLDVPRSLPRSAVYDTSENTPGYAQMLARYLPDTAEFDVNAILYPTHGALFAPWGQFTYVGTSKQAEASPSFQALLIQRAMILNQSVQYEWALPTNRRHTLKLGKPVYNVPKKLLDEWQKLEGVGVNAITKIPDLGMSLWGNSTLFEVPPATYQALANLSTRLLVNAVEDLVYRCGIAITFQYNNDQAYSAFRAGCEPLLDTMLNVGAIESWYMRMSADINGLERVNANTVIGKIYLVVNGVVNDIIVDLIALPPGTDLTQFMS